MNMRKLYLSLIALLVALTAAANDSEYFTCVYQFVPIQNTNIAVAKEVLTVNLTNNGFTNVEVYYEFRNDGPATDILMGFEAKPPSPLHSQLCGGDEWQKFALHQLPFRKGLDQRHFAR